MEDPLSRDRDTCYVSRGRRDTGQIRGRLGAMSAGVSSSPTGITATATAADAATPAATTTLSSALLLLPNDNATYYSRRVVLRFMHILPLMHRIYIKPPPRELLRKRSNNGRARSRAEESLLSIRNILYKMIINKFQSKSLFFVYTCAYILFIFHFQKLIFKIVDIKNVNIIKFCDVIFREFLYYLIIVKETITFKSTTHIKDFHICYGLPAAAS